MTLPWQRTAELPNRWVAVPRPRAHALLRLFCFPYAGGTAAGFHTWSAKVPPAVEVCAVQLPGRANRLRETPFVRLTALVPALEDALSPLLDRPFAFFGHSMGALLAFELARQLRKTRDLEPLHLFASAAKAPGIPNREPHVHTLPEAEFVRALRHLEGTPAEVLGNPDMMALVAPAVRADFAVCETYRYRKGPKLTCPITAIGGHHDRRVPRADLEAWAAETSGSFTMRMLPGGHYFIREQEDRVLQSISSELSSQLRPRPYQSTIRNNGE